MTAEFTRQNEDEHEHAGFLPFARPPYNHGSFEIKLRLSFWDRFSTKKARPRGKTEFPDAAGLTGLNGKANDSWARRSTLIMRRFPRQPLLAPRRLPAFDGCWGWATWSSMVLF